MSNLKEIQQIKSLIVKGKQKGFLTFDELNKALPSEVNNPEQLEEVIAIFDQLDINIVDTDKDGRKVDVATSEPDDAPDADLELTESEDTLDYSSRSTDPVRMPFPGTSIDTASPVRPRDCSGSRATRILT